jgi:alanine racemase
VTRFAAEVDLDAIRDNVAELRRRAGSAAVMAVVKADGYGHGLVPSATAALEGGASWLGVAFVEEAVALRAAGIAAPLVALVTSATDDLDPAVGGDVDLGVSGPMALRRAAESARRLGRRARVHLEVDTGLARGGATVDDWPEFVDTAVGLTGDGLVEVVGIWSHFVYADSPTHPTIAAQHAAFRDALELAHRRGLRPELRHLANSAATLALPDTHYDLVRPGVGVFGLSPGSQVGEASALGLRPAMRLLAEVALVKRVQAGQGVSYGHRYVTQRETTLVLVPLGYADGVPRHAGNVGPVQVAGGRFTVSGTVCMDQFVVDVGDLAVATGDEVVLFGRGDRGEPTADDWAAAIGTINYEIVTRVGARVPRVYLGGRG